RGSSRNATCCGGITGLVAALISLWAVWPVTLLVAILRPEGTGASGGAAAANIPGRGSPPHHLGTSPGRPQPCASGPASAPGPPRPLRGASRHKPCAPWAIRLRPAPGPSGRALRGLGRLLLFRPGAASSGPLFWSLLGWVSPVSTAQAPGCLQAGCHPCLQQG